MGLNYDQIDDLVALTLQKMIKKGAFVDMQTDITDFVGVREIWNGRETKFEGGNDWEFDIQTDHNHSARTVGLYENDGSSINDSMVKGKVEPRHVNAHYLYDLREKDFQRGGTAIVNLLKTKYVGMEVSFFELMEELLWGKPADSSDSKTPFGVGYWVTKGATEGFSGLDPAGFSGGRAGITSASQSRWANWSAVYAEVSKTDLIRKMRRTVRMTNFRSPVSHAVPDLAKMGNGIYVGDRIISLMEEALEAQNMNLGNDLASKDGRATFKSTPITYVPKLDDDSSDPVYMLDWRKIGCGIMAGWKNNLSKPQVVAGKHLVRRVDRDASWNMICTDLRKQAVLHKG